MRYIELIIEGKSITSEHKINQILKSKKFYWLIDSEIENAVLEIKKDTIIWYSGDFYTGNWNFGIFKNGNFHGTFKNGIWEGGNFKGKWISGVKI